MKKLTICLLLVVAFFMLCSCKNYQGPEKIEVKDQIAAYAADSTYYYPVLMAMDEAELYYKDGTSLYRVRFRDAGVLYYILALCVIMFLFGLFIGKDI